MHIQYSNMLSKKMLNIDMNDLFINTLTTYKQDKSRL